MLFSIAENSLQLFDHSPQLKLGIDLLMSLAVSSSQFRLFSFPSIGTMLRILFWWQGLHILTVIEIF
jgi:hypothetical protein